MLLESPEKGAEPLIWLATSNPGSDWQSGEYYEKHKLGKVNPQAREKMLVDALWTKSEQFTAPVNQLLH